MLGVSCVPSHRDRTYVAGEVERRSGSRLAAPSVEPPGIPPGVSLADGLSDDEAVSIALWNNAAFQVLLADLGFARADLIQAGLLANPVFSILFPLGPKQLEFALKLPIEALWLRPKRVTAARISADAGAERLVQNGLDLVRDVRVACATLRLAGTRAELAREAARLAENITRLAEDRLRAGDASELEIAAPRVEVLLARDEALHAGRELAIARARLATLLGGVLDVTDVTLRELPGTGLDVPHLVATALAGRPDMRAAELAVEAARVRAGLSRFEVLAVSGIADANGKGTQGFEIGPGLEVGIPIFNWNQGGMARTDADLERAVQLQRAVRERIELEVAEAVTRFETAGAQAMVWRERVLPELEATVQRAERGYQAGDVPLLLLLQTSAELVKSQVREAETAAETVRARAELERSIGSRLEAGSP
jgi:cobalt-zinc-cadmium efflux system outer membrane protein